MRELIDKLARTQAPVYITGESGSGKELAARLIHGEGARRERPFVPVNCGAIPENLMESEFFGYKKGAFTGAEQDRDGFFQAAHGGTLFLDEVADLPLAMQVKLLRAIQEKRVRKVGATQEDPVDVRMISATHQDLARLVEAAQVPPGPVLPAERDRAQDAAAARVPRGHAADRGQHPGAPRAPERRRRRAARLSAAALEELAHYDFPGNIRELENILERAIALSGGSEIGPEDLRLKPAPTDEAGARPRRRGARRAAARLPRPARARGDPGGAGAHQLQPHRRRQAARRHLPHPALPHAAARHHEDETRP